MILGSSPLGAAVLFSIDSYTRVYASGGLGPIMAYQYADSSLLLRLISVEYDKIMGRNQEAHNTMDNHP